LPRRKDIHEVPLELLDIIDNIIVGIYGVTLEGKIVYGNSTFAEMFGFQTIGAAADFPVIDLYYNIGKLNVLSKKIGKIKKYEAIDYVAGVKIVGIEKAS